jgi:DNA-binding NarL/FixJ family response regulator
MHEETLYAERALADGACGYVTKQQPTAVLIHTLRQAAHGSRGNLPASIHAHKAARLPLGALSDRELEVFELRGQGLTGDHIAARLNLSRKTVDTHLQHIKEKLRLKDSAELLERAVEWMQIKHTL